MNDHFNWIKNRQGQLREEALKDADELYRLLFNYTHFYRCPGKLANALRDSVLVEESLLYELFILAVAWQAQQDYQLVRDTAIRSVLDLIEQQHPPKQET